jgi:uncharacterized membrane protein
MNRHSLRNYFIAGLLVWIPIWVTWLMISFIVETLDKTLSFLPTTIQPEHLWGHHIPGLGVILSVCVVLATGLIATNLFGKRLVILGEAILNRIPFVRSIYKAVKQVMETIFSSNSNAFRKVLLIEYPRNGLWSLGFQTSTIAEDDLVAVFIPTTPNPTSGFLVMVPNAEVIEMEMSVDEAFKMIISLGVMQPKMTRREVEHHA